jgi:hypothetical protein
MQNNLIWGYSVNGLIFQAENGAWSPYGGAVLIMRTNFQFSAHKI